MIAGGLPVPAAPIAAVAIPAAIAGGSQIISSLIGKGGKGGAKEPPPKSPIPAPPVGQLNPAPDTAAPALPRLQLGQMNPQSFALEQLRKGGYG